MKTIAALLTVHNRREKTLASLRLLFKQSLPDGVAIVVFMTDDGCSDGTPQAVKNEFPNVNIIDGDGNLFWNRGMHRAWTVATAINNDGYDYYLWLNDDTMLLDGAITALLQTSSLYDDNAIVVGSTCSAVTGTTTYGGRTASGALAYANDQPTECTMSNGNILLVPRSVYNTLGTNDPRYHHSLGDFDYGLRAQKLGIKVVVAPGHLGECELHETVEKWKNPDMSLSQRWNHFMSPTGANPFEYFGYRRRHYGLLRASATFASNFIHVLFPRLWKSTRR